MPEIIGASAPFLFAGAGLFAIASIADSAVRWRDAYRRLTAEIERQSNAS